MKKRCLAFLLLLSLVTVGVFASGDQESADSGKEKVVLRMGSWRMDDVAQMEAVLAEFTKTHPGIEILFQPTNPPDYNATLRLQLESGTGPDIMYARSYATGIQLFEDGYLSDLTSLPGLDTTYSEGNRAPWMTKDGKNFAIPFTAVSHGVFYNKDIFKELGLSIPESWSDFLSVCKKIKAAGYIPVANSLGDEWDINEVVFMNLAPNFIGGREGRLAYDEGKTPFNDKKVVALFQAMASLAPYLPEGFEALTYNDSNALFATGQAAMYFDGSWTLGTFSDVDFDWGVFAPPAPDGQKVHYICFHPDAGMAINSSTKYPEEAKIFLEWLGSPEGAQVLAENLPMGMFPMSNIAVEIEDPHAKEFLSLNEGRQLDVRWAWPELLGGDPSGYNLMMEGSIGVVTGRITPKQAADNLQEGLAKWYPPAQKW